jgi:hypothetical protein
MFVDRLTEKDIDGLLTAEKAERRYETAMKIERFPVLPIGRPAEQCAIHGGAESLSSTV